MSKVVHLITVGKLKSKVLESIEKDYLKRIKNLKIHEVKARAEDKAQEGKAVISKIDDLCKGQNSFTIVLSEWGKEYTSIDFSKFLYSKIEQDLNIFFVICGAEGPSEELLKYSKSQLSLSKLTFPHKIARLLFIEQFYRAITIHNNHPYHN